MEYNLKHFAYIGDSVWEMYVRMRTIALTSKTDIMHKKTTQFVCAKFQAEALDKILEKLTPEELELQRRARNLKITVNKRSNPAMHSSATSFEALVGYFYLEHPERLKEVIEPLLDEIK